MFELAYQHGGPVGFALLLLVVLIGVGYPVRRVLTVDRSGRGPFLLRTSMRVAALAGLVGLFFMATVPFGIVPIQSQTETPPDKLQLVVAFATLAAPGLSAAGYYARRIWCREAAMTTWALVAVGGATAFTNSPDVPIDAVAFFYAECLGFAAFTYWYLYRRENVVEYLRERCRAV